MEHLQHFGLTHDPFSNEADLRLYFESGVHRDAQRRVERSLRQRKGFTLLTGDGGMGKTLLTRRILEALEEEVFEATMLVMLPGAADGTGILQRFARQLGCEEPAADRAALLGQIYEHLAIVREDGRHAVLMIDDAQIMTPEVFAELAGLLNLEYEDRRLLSMFFVGSSELDRLVQNDPSLMPRVDVRVALQPLDPANATAYLHHRMSIVGGNPAILPPEAMETLFKFGRGRPRLLNTLADNALFEAYLGGRQSIEPGDVERAAGDLGIGPDPGETYTQLGMAPVPPAAPPLTGQAETAMPAVTATPALDLDEPLTEFATELDAEPAPASATLDLDQGVASALDELSIDPGPELEMPAPSAALEPTFTPEPAADLLEFASAPPSVTAFPVEGAEEAPARPLATPAPTLAAVEPETVLLSEEPALEVVEAQFAPLSENGADALDDAFVELLEE